MKYSGQTGEFFELVDLSKANQKQIAESGPNELSFVWFQSGTHRLIIDHQEQVFQENDILFLTEFHQVEVEELGQAKLLRWNKPFYCILNHDSEVGCKGVLFYGASDLPIIHPEKEEKELFTAVWKMLEFEMRSQDSLQGEMLQMMLKRILILSTRMYKEQRQWNQVKEPASDLIRQYHFLVEKHFRCKHTVAEYAELLHKSPKTLSNLFKQLGSKSPLQYIKDRKLLEAKRLLAYTDKTASEIGYELGFADVQSFSRFFKKEEGQSPTVFQELTLVGKNG